QEVLPWGAASLLLGLSIGSGPGPAVWHPSWVASPARGPTRPLTPVSAACLRCARAPTTTNVRPGPCGGIVLGATGSCRDFGYAADGIGCPRANRARPAPPSC